MLPIPALAERSFGRVSGLTDEDLFKALGARIAFTTRQGGVSAPPFDGLNLASNVGDDEAAVAANRSLLLEEIDAPSLPLVAASQVHGTDIVTLASAAPADLAEARAEALRGSDGLVVAAPGVAALLCFADCVPVIVVSPTGSFAVAHAGWRGAAARISSKAVRLLAALDPAADPATFNAYIGPRIGPECFEVGRDLAHRFADEFGEACAPDDSHVDLAEAVAVDLVDAGLVRERIADAKVCTVCDQERFFSYRGSGGTCGRHGAIAVRLSEKGDDRSL